MSYEMKTFDEVCTFIDYRGKTPTKTESGIPLITAKNVADRRLDFTIKEYISEEDYDSWMTRGIPHEDDLLFTTEAPLGKVAMLGTSEKVALAQRLLAIRANKEVLYPFFLMYSISSPVVWGQIIQRSSGSTVKGIRSKELKKVKIPLPPLNTQKKIVEILDRAQSLIDTRKAQITEMDSLVQSLFYDMFGDPVSNPMGWDVKKLGDCLKVDTKMIKDFSDWQNLPHIGIDSIEKQTGALRGFRTVAEDNLTSGKYAFSDEHIIYSKIRPNLNKVALPTFKGLCSADAYPLLVDKTQTNRIFIALILRSEYFLNEILQHSTRTNIPKVNKTQLLSFKTVLPPIDLQNTFADRVQKIEAQKAAMTASLSELEDNFNALMQRAFKGELV